MGDGSASKNATVLFSSRTEINEVFDAFGERKNEADSLSDPQTFTVESVTTPISSLSNHELSSDSSVNLSNTTIQQETLVEV